MTAFEIKDAKDELPLEGVGAFLRKMREDSGLSLAQVAEQTRISTRFLEFIEQDQFDLLPARSYAIGFSRTYARHLGLNETEILAQLRCDLDKYSESREPYIPSFEPGDPAKAPPVKVVWISIALVFFVSIGSYFVLLRDKMPGADPYSQLTAESQLTEAISKGSQNIGSIGIEPFKEVIFKSMDQGIWVSIYEAGGRRFVEKHMDLGETFLLPQGVKSPQIWTARPDAIMATVGGEQIPRLAERQTIIKDFDVSAEALLALRFAN